MVAIFRPILLQCCTKQQRVRYIFCLHMRLHNCTTAHTHSPIANALLYFVVVVVFVFIEFIILLKWQHFTFIPRARTRCYVYVFVCCALCSK